MESLRSDKKIFSDNFNAKALVLFARNDSHMAISPTISEKSEICSAVCDCYKSFSNHCRLVILYKTCSRSGLFLGMSGCSKFSLVFTIFNLSITAQDCLFETEANE